MNKTEMDAKQSYKNRNVIKCNISNNYQQTNKTTTTTINGKKEWNKLQEEEEEYTKSINKRKERWRRSDGVDLWFWCQSV